ncbi:hypothetical protein F5141DRAFT_1212017 [Pisolithus sp. B1]|nr:hypothetical protein F5141DRAFT_1212017 [Pisolithus sp. B1]
MKAALITFHYLPTSHMDEELAKTILHLINHAEIQVDKIGHFTMDNAANNDIAMVVFMQTLQEEHEFDLDPVAHCIHYFPHIINICIQHLINGYKCVDFSSLLRTWGNAPRVLQKMEYNTAVQEDPIWYGWVTVQCVHNSGQHWHNFQQTIEFGNAKQSFMKGGVPFSLPVV